MDSVPLLLLLQSYSLAQSNTERQARGPFIPRLKPRGFLAHFCNSALLRATSRYFVLAPTILRRGSLHDAASLAPPQRYGLAWSNGR